MSSENGRVSSGTRLVEGREGDKAPTGGDRRAVKEPHVGTSPVATYAGQLGGAGREIAHVNIRVIVNHIVRDQVSGGGDEGNQEASGADILEETCAARDIPQIHSPVRPSSFAVATPLPELAPVRNIFFTGCPRAHSILFHPSFLLESLPPAAVCATTR